MGDSMNKEEQQKAYEQFVKEKTPVANLGLNMGRAFLLGGAICTVGQMIFNFCQSRGLESDMAGSVVSLCLVLFSVVLTGLNVYQKFAQWGGCGALVPITGFANSVAAPAIEYQKEGQVYGIGCKIFTIAGPVILYGIFTSWCLGLIYWTGKMLGVV